MKALHMIAWRLLVVGGLNWGLMGINSSWNIVMKIFGGFTDWVYILVGLSALLELFTHGKNCRMCKSGGGM